MCFITIKNLIKVTIKTNHHKSTSFPINNNVFTHQHSKISCSFHDEKYIYSVPKSPLSLPILILFKSPMSRLFLRHKTVFYLWAPTKFKVITYFKYTAVHSKHPHSKKGGIWQGKIGPREDQTPNLESTCPASIGCDTNIWAPPSLVAPFLEICYLKYTSALSWTHLTSFLELPLVVVS